MLDPVPSGQPQRRVAEIPTHGRCRQCRICLPRPEKLHDGDGGRTTTGSCVGSGTGRNFFDNFGRDFGNRGLDNN
jgi:hypothetical protein